MTDPAAGPPGGPSVREHLLFSYGTLALPDVQQALFGRLVRGAPDALVGFERLEVAITDPEVVRTSGLAVHPILVRSADPLAEVGGVVLALSGDELAAADRYEVDDYTRVRADLRSGGWAWAFVAEGDRA